MLWQIIMAKQAGGPKRDQPAPADEDRVFVWLPHYLFWSMITDQKFVLVNPIPKLWFCQLACLVHFLTGNKQQCIIIFNEGP